MSKVTSPEEASIIAEVIVRRVNDFYIARLGEVSLVNLTRYQLFPDYLMLNLCAPSVGVIDVESQIVVTRSNAVELYFISDALVRYVSIAPPST